MKEYFGHTLIDLESGAELFLKKGDDSTYLKYRTDKYFFGEGKTVNLIDTMPDPNGRLLVHHFNFYDDHSICSHQIRPLDSKDAKVIAEKALRNGVPEIARLIDRLFPASTGWVKMSDQEIAHINENDKIQKKITDIFNFKTREHQRIIDDLSTKSQSVTPLRSFDDIKEKDGLIEAAREFKAKGGDVDERIITMPGFAVRHKKDFPGSF